MFNSLRSERVFDNARGNASEKLNKTSVYIYGQKKFQGDSGLIVRLCNISLTNIDGFDDYALDGDRLIEGIIKAVELSGLRPENLTLKMSRACQEQITIWLTTLCRPESFIGKEEYTEKEFYEFISKLTARFKFFVRTDRFCGVPIEVDENIGSDEPPVV